MNTYSFDDRDRGLRRFMTMKSELPSTDRGNSSQILVYHLFLQSNNIFSTQNIILPVGDDNESVIYITFKYRNIPKYISYISFKLIWLAIDNLLIKLTVLILLACQLMTILCWVNTTLNIIAVKQEYV